MKKMAVRNSLIIVALTLMIAFAGYLNFTGKGIDLTRGEDVASEQEKEAVDKEVAFAETDDAQYEENIELNSDENEIGEAVLTSAETLNDSIMSARLRREQNLSLAKSNYMEIINDDNLGEQDKQSAIDAYVKLTDDAAKEADCESSLTAKGFTNSLVTITESGVEVIIGRDIIDEAEKIQIEDVVTRATGCDISDVVISLVSQ